MSGYNQASKGSPNLEALQFFQENVSPAELAEIKRVTNAVNVPLNVAVVTIAADATGGVTADIPVGSRIVDAVAIATAASGSGSALIANDGDAVATALVMAVDGVAARMIAGIDDTKLVVAGDVTVTTNGAADRGIVEIFYIAPSEA